MGKDGHKIGQGGLMLTQPIGSILIPEKAELPKPKTCNCCKTTWNVTPSYGIFYKDIFYFNCSCKTTLAIKGFKHENIQANRSKNPE